PAAWWRSGPRSAPTGQPGSRCRHRPEGGPAMTTTLTVASDDPAIIKQVVDERPSTSWHLPVATTVLGLLALLFFGLRGLPGVEPPFHLAREGDRNPPA